MNKKKAIKIATATAIAASGFVAVAPSQSQAAANVSAEVSKAKKVMYDAMYTYSKPYVADGTLTSRTVVYAAYKKGEAQYKYAVNVLKYEKDAKKRAAYKADLDKVRNTYLLGRALNYIKTLNALELQVQPAAKKLDAVVASANVTEQQIKDAQAEFKKVYDAQQKDLAAVVESNIEATVKQAAKASYDKSNAAADKKAEEVAVPKVASVSAINGKALEVKFNKAVDATLLNSGVANFTGFTLKTGKFEIVDVDGANTAAIESTPQAKLSADGKTLTVYAASGEVFDGKYTVTAKANSIDLAGVTGKFVEGSTSTVSVKDTVRPTVKEVKYVNNSTARVYFSEPLEFGGAVTASTNDSTITTLASAVPVDGQDYLEFNLATLPANKDVQLTVKDLVDFKGNVQAVNPASVTVKKDTNDTVAPSVVSVTPTSNTTFDVKFSEAVDATTVAAGDFTVNSTPANGVTADATDATVFHVTAATPVTGLATVTVGTINDKSGNPLTAFTGSINFSLDGSAPTVTSTNVERINGVEYLVATFNKDVKLVADAASDAEVITISHVKDLVTTTDSDVDLDGVVGSYSLYKPDANGKSKSIQIKLSALTSAVVDANYSAKLAAGIVTDYFGNSSVAKDVTFKRTSDFAAGNTQDALAVFAYGDSVPAPVSASVTNPNEVYVQFDKKLDSSALVTSNYVVEGASVTKAEIVSNTGLTGENIVKLTLAADSVTTTVSRYVTVKNITTPNGNAMTEESFVKSINENVRPAFVKSELVAGTTDKIKLTFSEALTSASVTETATPVADFAVTVGGTTLTGVTEALDTDTKVVVLDLGRKLTATELNSTIVAKATTDFTVTDATGLNAVFSTATVK